MPILTLRFKETSVGEYRLEKGKTLTIGRGEENDVVIENLAVSGQHAKIDSVGEGFLLTDLQSKNGSFVNNELISTYRLKQGDIITIGKHSLHFAYEEGESQPEEKGAEMERTMVMDTDKYRDMLAKSFAKIDPSKEKSEPVGVLSYLSGGQGEVTLTKKLSRIGKDSSSEIVVRGLTVAQTAATISRRPNGYHLSYVGGMSKPKVNGQVLKESIVLNDFDIITIGSVKMQFVMKQ